MLNQAGRLAEILVEASPDALVAMSPDGIVLFSYGQVVTSTEWAPAGDYLETVSKQAFR